MSRERLAVLGAGVMGAQIAAHMANAGFDVELLDIVPAGATDRDRLAQDAIARLARTEPPPLAHPSFVRRIRPGNLEDHRDRLSGCLWVVEAVVEDAAIKRRLYARIAPHLDDTALLSTNTSTLPRRLLAEGMPADLARRFFVTHFFNPPRYMRLLELVAPPDGDPEAKRRLVDICDRRLGKSVVEVADRPGFVANRLGAFWIGCAVRFARQLGLSVEEADLVMGRPFGFPKTGVFGLIDLVGLDLVPKVAASLAAALPADDPWHEVGFDLPILACLLAEGYTGRKGKGGFYRRRETEAGRVQEVVDLATGEWRPVRKVAFASVELATTGGPGALLEASDKGAAYARAVILCTLAYAGRILGEVTDDLEAIDRAMRAGYGWKHGPFELADAIGPDRLLRLAAQEGIILPQIFHVAQAAGGFYRVEGGRLLRLTLAGAHAPIVRPEGVLLLGDVKRAGAPVAQNGSASLWDLGDGVLCFEIRTKLATIDPAVLDLLARAIEMIPGRFRALILHNEDEPFSAGANLALALFAANVAAFETVGELIEQGQRVYTALRSAPFPVVAAPSGLALGGGCELLLAADRVVAHLESYIGLVECGVGLVPAWGGCARLLARLARHPQCPKGPVAPVARAFETIGMAKVARSAFEARDAGFLTADDAVVMNRDRLLAEAKATALAMAEDYRPPEPARLHLPGPTGKAALGLVLHDLDLKGMLTPHDRVVADALADVLSGGPDADHIEPLPEAQVMALEREAFLRLLRTEATLARIEHLLEIGRPLRN